MNSPKKITLITFCFIATIGCSQTTVDTLKIATLNEVVVTGQYEPTIAEQSVQKIKVIDSKKIEAMGAVNLRDVLTNQLNIRINQDNVLGSSMTLQGISGQNVKILIDGVPVIGRLNGDIDLSQINMNNVERIEIVEGPLSVQYGTNALAGTINIITKKTSTKKYSLSVTPYYESIGTFNVTADGLIKIKKTTLGISGGRNYFAGWNPTDAPFVYIQRHIADSTRYQQWKPKEQDFNTLNITHQFKEITTGFKSSYFNENIVNRGLPRAPYNETAFDDHYKTVRIDNSIYANGKFIKNWNLNFTGAFNYYTRTKKTCYKDLTTLSEIITSPADQDTSQFTQLMSRTSFSRTKESVPLNYEIGYDINYQSALSKRIENQLQYMGDYALFVTAEYKPAKSITIKPGLRYSYNTVYQAPLLPSLNLKWILKEKHTIRASYAQGFRAPDLKELYFLFIDINHNIVGNQNLKAEQSDNYTFAYNFNTNFDQVHFKIDYSLFYNDITSLITLAQTTGNQYSYMNIGKYKTKGFQVSSTLGYKSFNTTAGFNYTGRYNQLSTDFNIDRYFYSPEFNLNTSYTFQQQKLTLALFYKYNGKLPSYVMVDDVIQQSYINSYQLMDFTISKKLFKEHVNMIIGVKNIFDITNVTANVMSSIHGSGGNSIALSTGRNYFMKLTYRLWKD